MIAYAAADLIWATRIKRTAEALGLRARPCRTPDALRDRLADSDVRAFIVDLTLGEPAIDLVATVREHPAGRRVRVLAFGPHVQRDLMQRARDAGADDVLPRGALDRDLPDLLIRLDATER